MPLFSSRRRRSNETELPEYEKREHPDSKDRYSDDEEYVDDSDDSEDSDQDDYDDGAGYSDRGSPVSSHPLSPSLSGPRARPLLGDGRRAYSPVRARRYRQLGPLRFYRLPNRTARYIGLFIIIGVTVFILSLIRASQVENWKIVNGKIDKKPPPPHSWMSFRLLTRYYGGLGTVVPRNQNVPEYPTVEDQQVDVPKKAVQADEPAAGVPDVPEKMNRPIPRWNPRSSKPFTEHPQSVFSQEGGANDMAECFVDKENKVHIPPVRYYEGRPYGFPEHAVGSYDVLGLPDDICFERFGRFGPYGFGYSQRMGGLGTGQYGEKNGSEAVWEKHALVDYRNVDWANVQQRCYEANAHRFKALEPRPLNSNGWYIHNDSRASTSTAGPEIIATPEPAKTAAAVEPTTSSSLISLMAKRAEETPAPESSGQGTPPDEKPPAEAEQPPLDKPAPSPSRPGTEKPSASRLSRTALVIRVWDEYTWREEDIMNIRSLIVELSMASGGRYDVHLLVQVRDDAAHPIWADREAYEDRIRSSVPEEFRGLVTLWTQTQMLSLYQGIYDEMIEGIPIHGSYRGLSMAMQYFGYNHPEYDYFWQWEMDARYIGHYLDLLQKIEGWALQQPRKGLWERSERFYVPRVHGSWEEFKQMAKIQAEMGTTSADNVWKNVKDKDNGRAAVVESQPDPLIWGPRRPSSEEDWFEPENDPVPPTKSYDNDSYQWGVGEEADLISLYPIYDPVGTTWYWFNDITGYKTDRAKVPRRSHIVVTSRVSRKLLLTMHRETAYKKHFAFPEMWQATVALQHGYKAVSVPHPMFIDREWPSRFLAQTLNAGKDGASGGARTAIYGSREHNAHGLTWFYNSHFAPALYRRWLGLRVEDSGGEQFETEGDMSKTGKNVNDMRGGEGRMCLPPMLIHPAKDLELPVEILVPEEQPGHDAPESDPTA